MAEPPYKLDYLAPREGDDREEVSVGAALVFIAGSLVLGCVYFFFLFFRV